MHWYSDRGRRLERLTQNLHFCVLIPVLDSYCKFPAAAFVDVSPEEISQQESFVDSNASVEPEVLNLKLWVHNDEFF